MTFTVRQSWYKLFDSCCVICYVIVPAVYHVPYSYNQLNKFDYLNVRVFNERPSVICILILRIIFFFKDALFDFKLAKCFMLASDFGAGVFSRLTFVKSRCVLRLFVTPDEL
jgi:hypothetical protein